jgi:membrane peptidoglycan carboxypeptidase
VTRIEDSEGNVVAEFQPRVNEVISSESANKMIVMLKGVIDNGTGHRMRHRYNMKCEMGGKTGTTEPAGHCLIILSQNEKEEYYISVVMKTESLEDLYDGMNGLLAQIPN